MRRYALSCDYEFQQAAAAEDGRAMERTTLGFLTVLLNIWLEETHEKFESFLRIFRQKYDRAKRVLGVWSPRETCIFYLGALFAAQRIFEELYRAEGEREKLISTFAVQSPRSEEILLCLYRRNGGTGMRHGELAAALGLSESALTNAMKRVLQSGAAEAARSGKNTFYTLSKAGQRYCAERAEKSAALTRTQWIEWTLRRLAESEPDTGRVPVLRGGDRAQVLVDGIRAGEFRAREILEIEHRKYINLEKIPDMAPRGRDLAGEFSVNLLLGELDRENTTIA